jgi:hypothetical protein
MIISKWEIKYPSAIQVKNLIDHRDYISIIKPIQSLIYEHQSIADDKKTSISEKKRLESLIPRIKSRLQEYTGEYWFTTESPLYLAFNTGILKLNYAEIKFEIRKTT